MNGYQCKIFNIKINDLDGWYQATGEVSYLEEHIKKTGMMSGKVFKSKEAAKDSLERKFNNFKHIGCPEDIGTRYQHRYNKNLLDL